MTQEYAHHDVRRFILLPSYQGHLLIVHNHHSRDAAVGAWREQWMHWGGCGVSDFHTVGTETENSIHDSAENVSYERRLAALEAICQPGGVAPAATDVAYECLD